MAISTTDVYLTPQMGWTLVATNPVVLVIKPATYHPWDVAITASGAPAATVEGIPMGRDGHNKVEAFEASNITGEVYVRIKLPVEPSTSARLRLGVIKDQ